MQAAHVRLPPASGARASPWRRFRAACLVAAVVFVLVVLTDVGGSGGLRTRARLVDAVLLLLAMTVAAACWRISRRAPGFNRRVWGLFSASGLCWATGRAFLLYDQQLPGGPPHHSLASPFLVAALVPAALALKVIPPEPREHPERVRAWLGVGIVLTSVLLFCRCLLLAVPAPASDAARPLTLLLQFSFPIAHIALACMIWIVLLRVGTQARLPLFLVTAALIVLAWVNVYWAYHVGTANGHARELLDVGSAWCFLLFILAALSPHAAEPRRPPAAAARSRYIGFQSLAVYLPVVSSTILATAVPHSTDKFVIGAGLLMLTLFGVRLVLLSMDNSRLRDDLECRVEDLTQRTSELRRLVLQNERIVQSVVDGVIGVDALGLVTFVNPAACVMLGSTREALLGKSEHEIFHGQQLLGPDTIGRAPAGHHLSEPEPLLNCCVVATSMNTGTAAASDSEFFVAEDGRVFPVELAVGPILEEGQITGAVVVFRDVTARHKLERMKNEFVSVVSHELRTPLTSIRGSLGLLAGGAAGALSSQGDRMVQVALDSSERLTRLVNDMLDIERIQSGTIPVLLTDCDPEELIVAAVEGLRALVSDHHVEIRTAYGQDRVRADADRIVQTLTNLLGNAVKFSPPSTTIRICAVGHGGEVEFTVSDKGRGIPADMIGRIFERFEQVDSSDSREMGGTGLGLAISRTIVRAHGGELSVTSQPGLGSTFRFTLPVSTPASSVSRAVEVLQGSYQL